MKKSSEIYDIAWDIAKLVENLDRTIIPGMNEDFSKAGSSMDIQHVRQLLNKAKTLMLMTIDTVEELVDYLDEFSDSAKSDTDKNAGPSQLS